MNPEAHSEDTPEVVGATPPPTFQHPEIERLYEIGVHDMDAETLRTLLGLPRTSLISDLEAVLRDAIARFDEFYARDKGSLIPFPEICFPLHALLFLAELRAKDSLPIVLEFLSQDIEAVDFWIGEFRALIWQPVLVLGQQDLPRLRTAYAAGGPDLRQFIPQALGQVAWHTPMRRPEIRDWLGEAMQVLLDQPKLRDGGLAAAGLIHAAKDLRFEALLPQIEALFEAEAVRFGTLGEARAAMTQPVNNWAKKQRRSLEEIYAHMRKAWRTYQDEDDATPDTRIELGGGGSRARGRSGKRGKSLTSFDPRRQPVRRKPKPGRNAPCPCGSGKKYK
ncbi:MAG: SEC-C metal-binding domain-containing protein, partial [Bacteroidota bacterium]